MLISKRLFPIWTLLLVAAALMFVYCGDSDEPTEPADPLAGAALCLSDSSCTMVAVCDTSAAIDVTNCGNSTVLLWTAAGNAAWLNVSVASGETPGQFCIMAESNRTGDERTATVTVTADDLDDESITVDVTQPSTGSELRVSLSEWEPSALGSESPQIAVANSGNDVPFDWAVTEDEGWLELSAASGSTPGSFIITADTNHGEGSRTGTVTVTAEGVTGSPWEITVEQPPIVALAGVYVTPGFGYNVFVSGEHAYVADLTSGLQIVDVSDPANPTLSGEYPMSGETYDVFVQDDFAYLATDNSLGLRILDVSNPADPTGVAIVAEYVVCVSVQGDYAYLVVGESGLFYVINVSTPSSPTLEGGTSVPSGLSDIVVSGDYVYMASRTEGLRVIDVSDPSLPDVVGSCDWASFAIRVAVTGDYAYVADGFLGVQIIDVSDPTDPYVVDDIFLGVAGRGVFVSGDYLYVTATDGSLTIFDISSPVDPVLVGDADLAIDAEGVYVSGGYAYVAVGGEGLLIIELGY